MAVIPEKFGRYEIVREIGHGAMGVVYEALDPTIGRRIALKAIRLSSSSGLQERAEYKAGKSRAVSSQKLRPIPE